MKRSQRDATLVLRYQAIGFTVIIALCWLDEYLALTYRVFGGVRATPNWREAIFETIFALAVWAVSTFYIRRLLARLFYLERFVRMCAWCRRLNHDDQWVGVEEFLELDFETRTSHAVCPDCEAKWVSRSSRLTPNAQA